MQPRIEVQTRQSGKVMTFGSASMDPALVTLSVRENVWPQDIIPTVRLSFSGMVGISILTAETFHEVLGQAIREAKREAERLDL